jgi:hypothetical protein
MFQTITKRIGGTNYEINIVNADIFVVMPEPPADMKEIFKEAVWQAIVSERPSGPRNRRPPTKGRRRGGVRG